jgi:hypothetical protein
MSLGAKKDIAIFWQMIKSSTRKTTILQGGSLTHLVEIAILYKK